MQLLKKTLYTNFYEFQHASFSHKFFTSEFLVIAFLQNFYHYMEGVSHCSPLTFQS